MRRPYSKLSPDELRILATMLQVILYEPRLAKYVRISKNRGMLDEMG